MIWLLGEVGLNEWLSTTFSLWTHSHRKDSIAGLHAVLFEDILD